MAPASPKRQASRPFALQSDADFFRRGFLAATNLFGALVGLGRQDHLGQHRVERELGHAAAHLGQLPSVVQCTQCVELCMRLHDP